MAFSQPTVEVYATGFVNPIGIEIDGAGNLWVGEQGTGSGNTCKSFNGYTKRTGISISY